VLARVLAADVLFHEVMDGVVPELLLVVEFEVHAAPSMGGAAIGVARWPSAERGKGNTMPSVVEEFKTKVCSGQWPRSRSRTGLLAGVPGRAACRCDFERIAEIDRNCGGVVIYKQMFVCSVSGTARPQLRPG
jgi:hypothetical protein